MTQVEVPDIGDFEDVAVVEILVAEGDEVAVDDPLIVLESDKASMEVPSTAAGTVAKLLVSEGDTVSEGDPIAEIEGGEGEAEEDAEAEEEEADAEVEEEEPAPSGADEFEHGDKHADVLVLGSGPGGYTAAFRAADLGLAVIMVERYASLGGVCLNVGCIPSKALLHVADVMAQAEDMGGHGVSFGEPELDLDAVRTWKEEVVERLTNGVAQMAKGRGVEVVEGEGRFTGPHHLDVEGTSISFAHAIVAAGSRPATLPDLPYDDERLMDSTDALGIEQIPETLLVIGGGIIGLEMATVYDALGAEVTVVEMADQLIPGADPDVVKPLHERIEGRYAGVHLETRVEALEPEEDGLKATFTEGGPDPQVFDRVLVAVGRTPNGAALGLEAAGVEVDDRGFIGVDERQRTNVDHIYAIGDVVAGPALAHKATYEAKVAAEVIAGQDIVYDARGIPAVAYTDPEVAWVGLTETQAKEDGTAYEASTFPWSASGRARGIDAAEGQTKVLVDPESRRVLGYGIVGRNAGELVAEATLALETGADADDMGLTIHAHPTLSETVRFAAELAAGTITDLPQRRTRSRR